MGRRGPSGVADAPGRRARRAPRQRGAGGSGPRTLQACPPGSRQPPASTDRGQSRQSPAIREKRGHGDGPRSVVTRDIARPWRRPLSDLEDDHGRTSLVTRTPRLPCRLGRGGRHGPCLPAPGRGELRRPRSAHSASACPRRNSPIFAGACRRRGGLSGRRSWIESQGVQLATMQKLARYWGTDYDWRKVEAKLNALPQFITRSTAWTSTSSTSVRNMPNALPLIVTHGWPGSVIEQLKIVGSTHQSHRPWRERIGRFRPRDTIDAGLRIFRQADHAPAGIPTASRVPGS